MIETIIIIISVALDRLSKIAAIHYLKTIETFPLWKDVFHLTYATNTGAAFSILSGHSKLLGVVSLIASIGFCIYLFVLKKKEKRNLSHIALAMIIGGAIGNGIDRLMQGFVVDYFDFRLINFAVFNVADSFVVVGVIFFIFDQFTLEPKRIKKRTP